MVKVFITSYGGVCRDLMIEWWWWSEIRMLGSESISSWCGNSKFREVKGLAYVTPLTLKMY